MNAIDDAIARARDHAASARSYADVKRSPEPSPPAADNEAKTSGFPPREWWRVYWPNGRGNPPVFADVFAYPPATFLEMRKVYPGSDMIPGQRP